MFDLLNGVARNCEGIDRRSFLKIGSLGGLGITLPMLLISHALFHSTFGRSGSYQCMSGQLAILRLCGSER